MKFLTFRSVLDMAVVASFFFGFISAGRASGDIYAKPNSPESAVCDDLFLRGISNVTPIPFEIWQRKYLDAARIISHGANPDALCWGSHAALTPLYLVSTYIRPGAPASDRWTALFVGVARILIERGASPTALTHERDERNPISNLQAVTRTGNAELLAKLKLNR